MPTARRFVAGVIPHFSDMPQLASKWRPSTELQLIDIQDPVEKIIDQIASCEFVVSSSLHAVIASHAFGIPAVWVKFRDLPNGDDSKFDDYFHSIGQKSATPVWLEYGKINPDQLARRVLPAVIDLDLEPLWQACPFRGEA